MGIGLIFGRRKAEGYFLSETDELTISLPALPRPTLEELQKKYSWIKSIERDTSPETPVTLTLATVLMPGEKDIGGGKYKRRLAPQQDVYLGFQHCRWLRAHQDESPAIKALFGIYIDFPGIVVRHDIGHRSVPSCDRGSTHWLAGWRWLGFGFSACARVAVARK